MCIIAYIPAGTQISEEMMKLNFVNNPDGAGMMWKEGKGQEIMIKKGYKTVEDLMNDYYCIPETFERAVHFRIATSGKISSATCHPFPVRKNVEEMRKNEDKTGMALMHNGIISFCTPKGGMSATFSDTMVFASKFLFPFRGMMNNKALQELIEHADNSRFLIFSKENEPILLGKWEEKDGIMYSNGTFRYEKRNYTCYDNNWYNNYRKNWKGQSYDYESMAGTSTGTKAPTTLMDDKTSTASKKKDKIYREGTQLMMTIKADVTGLSKGKRKEVISIIYSYLKNLGCDPKEDYIITREGVSIAVGFLPFRKGGTICGYKWDYSYETLR